MDSNLIDAAKCPGSTTRAKQGSGVIIGAACTDTSGHVGRGSLSVNIDTTPPVVGVTGITDGATYPLGQAPLPQCTTADAVSGVGRLAAGLISGGRPDGTGVFTETCTGAVDNAGNRQAAPVTAHYTVVYDFGGFISPKPGSTLRASAPSITVRFRLVNQHGTAIPASTAAALAAHHDVRATLRGPGISPVVAVCKWNTTAKYLQCTIATPPHVRTGRSHRYTITATENLGSGFVTAPPTAASENPEPVYFR